MDIVRQMERTVLGWFSRVPHLPPEVKKWLGVNVWWIAAIAAAICGLAALGLFVGLLGQMAALTGTALSYYASSTFLVWLIVRTIVSLVFTAFVCALLVMAVTPLKAKQRKGWVLVFTALLISLIGAVAGAVLTLDTFGFITRILFSLVMLAIWAYFLFEIHSEFAQVERSKGVKAKKQ